MIKNSIFSLLAIATLLIGAALADGVVIDHNLPQTLQPGEKTIVTVNINKGEVTGFAKLQLEIPAGLTARPIKKSGASFTFSGQKAKFIWMTLPDHQQFSIEYELEANTTSLGSKVITGEFSYIKANNRVDYELAPQVINIGDEVADNSDSSSNSKGTNSIDDPVCTRTLSMISPGEYFVEITAENISSDGFAKIIDNVNSGFTIEEDDAGESIVTVEDDQIKFVWFEKPSSESFTVSYKMSTADFDLVPNINGNISYVSNNRPEELLIIHQDLVNPKDMGDSADTMADNTTQDSSDTNQTEDSTTTTINSGTDNSNTADNSSSSNNQNTGSNTQNDTADNSANNTQKEDSTQDNTDTTQADNTTSAAQDNASVDNTSASNIPDPETGITYKVQLSATHKYVTAANFKKKHGFNNTIQTENHEGWTKFVTGSHTVYKDARDARNTITSSNSTFRGPFVTAYNNGERITVQEALMISKQRWYQ